MSSEAVHHLDLSNVKFFGRTRELEILENALERTASQGGTELVTIEGYSGAGKSRLVSAFQKRFIHQQAYFCSAKGDPSRSKEPFSVIQEAFAELSSTLLEAKDQTSLQVIANLRQTLGSKGRILVNVAPCLAELLGQTDALDQGSSNYVATASDKARDQLHFLFRSFVRAITETRPLVIFCDDLQWSDGSSLHILSALVTDVKMTRLLLIGTFRDNEVTKDHLVMETAGVIERKKGKPIVHIKVDNLTAVELTTFVARILRLSPDETIELSSVVYQKTNGNVFFTLQFLHDLEQRKLLKYSFTKLRWTWADLRKIHNDTTIADNVVDLITNKLLVLSEDEQTCLKVASCLSSIISVSLLQSLLHGMSLCVDVDFSSILQGIEEQGFLVVLNSDDDASETLEYKFVHDRIQQAAYQLIPEGEEREKLHYNIGNILLGMIRVCNDVRRRDILMSIAADQLQSGQACIKDAAELVELASMNLASGERAIALGAYQPASMYLTNGITIMSGIVQSWERHHDILLTLHQRLADVLWCIGSPAKSVQLVKKVEQRAKTMQERLSASMTLAQALGAQEKHREAVAVEIRELRALGFIRRSFRGLKAVSLLLRLKKRLRRVTRADVLQLPMCEDPKIISALKFLFFTINHAGFSGDDILQLLAITMSVKLTLKHGVHEIAVGAFAQIGGIITVLFGDANEGYRLAMMTSGLLDQLGISNAAASLVIYGYIYPWNAPLTETLQPLLKAYNDGMKEGDIEFALICFTTYILNGYLSGLTLGSLLEDARTHYDTSTEYGIYSIMPVVRVIRQMLSNLVGHAENPIVMTGEAMDEARFLEANYSKIAVYNFYIYKTQVCYYYGELETAAEFLKEAMRYGNTATAFSEKSALIVFNAFVHLALASKMQFAGAKKHKRIARKAISAFRKFISKDSKGINLSHKLMLLDAGYLALDATNDERTVQQAFDRAITLAKRAGFRQDAALGNQLCGEYFLYRQLDQSWASQYLPRSIELFRDWGAIGVADSIQRKFKEATDVVTIT